MIAQVKIAFSTLLVTRCGQVNGFSANKTQVEVMHATSDLCVLKKEACIPLPMLSLPMSWNVNRVGSNKIERACALNIFKSPYQPWTIYLDS